MLLKSINMFCFVVFYLSLFKSFVCGQSHHHVNKIIRDSYNEVSAYITSHFNEKCNLALHNCLFQTQWDRLFGKEKLNSKSEQPIQKRRRRRRGREKLKNHITEEYFIHSFNNSYSQFNQKSKISLRSVNVNNDSYYYCQAFVVAKFCLDDYLKKSIDNLICVNGSDGNMPKEFKRSIYRHQCRNYYEFFFDSYNNSNSNYLPSNSIYFFYFFLNFYLFYAFFKKELDC
jgi:hypothetical protein